MTKRTNWVVMGVLAVFGGCQAPQVESRSQAEAIESVPVTSEAPRRLPELALGFDASDAPSIAAAQAGLRSHPDAPQSYVVLATVFLRAARAHGAAHRAYARDVIEVGLARTGDAPRLRLLSAMLLLDDHRFEQVVAAATELTGVLPYDPTPHLLIGDASLELGRYSDAETSFEAAIDLRPDLRSYNRVGYMRWLYGDFEGAVGALELALDSGSARDPESMAWCYADLGAMYLRRGQGESARKAAERALQLVPEYGPALSLKGRAMGEAGDFEAARDVLARAADRSPSAESILRVVELARALGRDGEAESGLADALAMGEHDPRPVAHFLARHGEQPAKALALAEQELRDRQNIWSWDTLAIAAARAGETTRALEALENAQALGTDDAEMKLHGALVALLAGTTDTAHAELEAALKARPGVDPLLVAELRGRLGAS
ncbi:MAG: tetratricopeptide repeat protein [Nannocystaceae bacterium]|nr:tetratricopeptide repeat protein [Nannocystaceae bacterium]